MAVKLSSYGVQVSFGIVLDLLECECRYFTPNALANLARSIDFLNSVIKSIDSFGIQTSQKKPSNFYFVPNLQKIIMHGKVTQGNSKITKDMLCEKRDYFLTIMQNLKLLQSSPDEFYSSNINIDDLKNGLNNIRNVYAQPQYIVERDYTLSQYAQI
jgi:hypothetical protein